MRSRAAFRPPLWHRLLRPTLCELGRSTTILEASPARGPPFLLNAFERLRAALADRYVIERELGAGGMATVYLAEDLRHHRKVAVKVLRPELARVLGPERFLREIEIAAGLTHAHILPVHDSGEAGGFLYYVMPYIEGETLRTRLAREGELPVSEAVRILRDVIDALASAHKRGVVHRDIKPDNVLLAENHGYVTDFGVAKAVSEATGRQQLTTVGVALGTPIYMAPEQAAADPHLDHRVDIYAVGVLAYELLTGRPPFAGGTAQQILAAHLTETPIPVTTLRGAVPRRLSELVMKCLEKSPGDRWQSADDMLARMDEPTTPTGGTTAPTVAPRDTRARTAAKLAVVTGIVVAIAVLGFLGWASFRPTGTSVTFSNIRQITRAPEIEIEPSISPGGGEIAYTAGFGLDMNVYVRDLSGGRPIALTADRPGSQGLPRWAPDGRSIAFTEFWQGEGPVALMVPRFGGPARPIADAVVFGLNGDRVGYARRDSIFVRSLAGGDPTFVAHVPPQPHSIAWSPDGSRLAYVQGNVEFLMFGLLGNVAPSAIWTVGLDGAEPAPVTNHPSLNVSPAWLPDGRRLLFISDRGGTRDIYLTSLDGSGKPRGNPVRLTTGLNPHSITVAADGSAAAYSHFIFRRNVWTVAIPDTGSASIAEARQVTVGNQIVESHALSPNGRWLSYDSNLEGNQDIYLISTQGGEARRLTTDPGDDFAPHFSPDGREIVFHSTRYGTRDLFVVDTDGKNEVRLTDDAVDERFPVFSPDGLHIAFYAWTGNANRIYLLHRKSVDGAWSEAQATAAVSPDGMHPRWEPNGARIVYDWGNAIGAVSPGDEPRRLFDGRMAGLIDIGKPDWSLDGRLIYFTGTAVDGSRALYALPATGGEPRVVVRYDDPTRELFFVGFSIGIGKVYVSLGEYEADIYAMDLETR